MSQSAVASQYGYTPWVPRTWKAKNFVFALALEDCAVTAVTRQRNVVGEVFEGVVCLVIDPPPFLHLTLLLFVPFASRSPIEEQPAGASVHSDRGLAILICSTELGPAIACRAGEVLMCLTRSDVDQVRHCSKDRTRTGLLRKSGESDVAGLILGCCISGEEANKA